MLKISSFKIMIIYIDFFIIDRCFLCQNSIYIYINFFLLFNYLLCIKFINNYRIYIYVIRKELIFIFNISLKFEKIYYLIEQLNKKKEIIHTHIHKT